MTTTRQHIEDLDVDRWATLTRRAAADAVDTAERLGMQPRAETVALAAMSERDLVRHRERNGTPVPRRSLAMQVVEADHLRSVAEDRARVAHQGRLDAEAAASLARGKLVIHNAGDRFDIGVQSQANQLTLAEIVKAVRGR